MLQQGPHDAGAGETTHRFFRGYPKVDDSSRRPEQFDDADVGDPAAAWCQHHWRCRGKLLRENHFQLPKRTFALLREKSGDRPANAALDLGVEVEERTPESLGDDASEGGFPGAWEPHQDHVAVDLGCVWAHGPGRRTRAAGGV